MKQLFLTFGAFIAVAAFAEVGVGQTQTMPASSSSSRPASMTASSPANYEGVVVDKDGKPLAGVAVRAFAGTQIGGKVTISLLDKTNTDECGKYSFAVAMPTSSLDAVMIIAEKNGYAIGCANVAAKRPYSGKILLGNPVTTGGMVVDDAGKPVAGARVQLFLQFRNDRYDVAMISLPECEVVATSTDADGSFEFKNTPEKAGVKFIVTAPGKATIFTGGRNSSTPLGGTKFEIKLPAEAVIQGVLKTKSDGKSIAGETIQAIPIGGKGFIAPQCVTDKDGKFRIGTLPDGTVTMKIVPQPDQTADWLTEAEAVTVKAGRTTDITLDAFKGGIMEVAVRDEKTRNPIAGAQVYIHLTQPANNRQNISTQTVTNANGLATIRQSPGEYQIQASFANYENTGSGQQIITIEDGKTVKAELSLKPQPVIKGSAKDEKGAPVADADVNLSPNSGASAKTDKAGNFSIHAQQYMLDGSNGTPTIIVRHTKLGLIGTMIIESADKEHAVTMTRGMTLNGLILDSKNKPIKEANVAVNIQFDSARNFIISDQATTNDKGEYKIATIPQDAGFNISASKEGYGIGRTSEVTLYPKTNTITADSIILAEANLTLAGRVEDQNGKPLADANVNLNGRNQPGSPSVTSDKNGKFTFKNLIEGPVSISASKNNIYGNVEAEAGDTDVIIKLQGDLNPPPPPVAVEDKPATTPATRPATVPTTKPETSPSSTPTTSPANRPATAPAIRKLR